MKRILVVDDDLSLLEVMRRTLVSAGYNVTAASNSSAALKTLDSESFDLLVTDYRMPEMSGRELIEVLQARFPEQRTLVVSGTPPEDGYDRVWWSRQTTLTKPFTREQLRDAVAHLIGPA